jgi:hypothetical protein
MTIDAILKAIRTLPIVERKRLISLIVDTLTENARPPHTHDILEFEGIAAHIADDEDPQQRINRMRAEWDEAQ